MRTCRWVWLDPWPIRHTDYVRSQSTFIIISSVSSLLFSISISNPSPKRFFSRWIVCAESHITRMPRHSFSGEIPKSVGVEAPTIFLFFCPVAWSVLWSRKFRCSHTNPENVLDYPRPTKLFDAPLIPPWAQSTPSLLSIAGCRVRARSFRSGVCELLHIFTRENPTHTDTQASAVSIIPGHARRYVPLPKTIIPLNNRLLAFSP